MGAESAREGQQKRGAPPSDELERVVRSREDHDMAVEQFCVLERFEHERRDNKRTNRMLDEIVAETTSKEFMEMAGLSCAERRSVARDLAKLGQELNDIHVAEIFSPPHVTAEASRMELTPGLAFDISHGWDLDNPENVQRLWQYLKQERPMLIVGSPECKACSRLQNLNRGSPNYEATLDRGIRHLRLCSPPTSGK